MIQNSIEKKVLFMTDKRILKTKQALKLTLIEMMKEQSFQKIKVKDLCERANTSKLTFYTHYDDKYALLHDVAADMEREVFAKYQDMQAQDPTENSIVKHNQNLLKAIISIEDKYDKIFVTAKNEQNYTFFMYFYDVLVNAFSDREKWLSSVVKSNYPITQLSAFLVIGLWGYANAANKMGISEQERHEQLFKLVTDLSNSDLFLK